MLDLAEKMVRAAKNPTETVYCFPHKKPGNDHEKLLP